MKEQKGMSPTTARALVAAAALSFAMTPTAVYAEEASVSGADLLIPKVGEFIPALIGFLVIFVVLAKFAWPQILASMERREQKIAGDIDAAEQARAEAQEQLEAYRAKMAGAQRDADAILAEAKQQAKESSGRIVDDARRQAADIVAHGRENVESERRAAQAELSESIADISVMAAGKIIDQNLDTEAQRKLVAKYLDEVGGFDAN